MATTSPWRKPGVIIYLVIIHLLALFFVLEKIRTTIARNGPGGGEAVIPPLTDSSKKTPADSGRHLNDTSVGNGVRTPSYSGIQGDTGKLLIPVAGVKRSDLQDTYTQSRSGGRQHNAIDIMAREGTPVVAVANGEIAKFFDSKLGGITIYQWSADKSRIYYYAHLQRRAEGLSEGASVQRGTVIGYVGNTGDAGPGNYHLHFGISLPATPGRYWSGTDINPYPVLKEGIEVPAGGRE